MNDSVQDDLFSNSNAKGEAQPPTSDTKKPKPKSLYFVTNEENLKQILVSGLIKTREGYRKYYKDFLELSPGLIPLFIDKIPSNALTQCQEEGDTSIAVVAIRLNISSSKLQKHVKAYVDENGKMKTGEPAPLADAKVIFIDKVLSINKVTKVYFENAAHMKNFERNESTLNNCDINIVKYGTNKTLFSKTSGITVSSLNLDKNSALDKIKQKYRQIDARIGCLSCLISTLPNIGKSRLIINSSTNAATLANRDWEVLPPALKDVLSWLTSTEVSAPAIESQTTLLILDYLASLDALQGLSSDSLAPLKEQSTITGNAGERLAKRLGQIEKISMNGDGVEAFFCDESMKSPVLRGFCLLILYNDCLNDPNLSKENIKKWRVSCGDLLFRNLFYATWKGWMKCEERPEDEKTIKALNNYQEYLHNNSFFAENVEFKFDIEGDVAEWTKDIILNLKLVGPEKAYAVSLSKEYNWACLESKIEAPKDNLEELSLGDKFSAKVKGTIKINEDIDEEKFKELFAHLELSDADKQGYSKLKRKQGGAK